MNLNELIYERLAGFPELADRLAKYAGQPAVFDSEFRLTSRKDGMG